MDKILADDFPPRLNIKKEIDMVQAEQDRMKIKKDDAIRSLCYLEGFLNGIFKAYGEDPSCKRQLDNLWTFMGHGKIIQNEEYPSRGEEYRANM